MKRKAFLLISALFCFTLNARIINIPKDYTKIQQGIDAAVNGDTVLVSPGIYHEQIIYNGKNILVASLYLTTGQDEYVSQTIIDGDSYGFPVVRIVNQETSAKLIGFTIQNGFVGSDWYSGGVCFKGSSGSLDKLIIKNNLCADGGRGGGITLQSSNVTVSNTIVRNNISSSESAVMCYGGTWTFTNCTFTKNSGSANVIKFDSGHGNLVNCLIYDNECSSHVLGVDFCDFKVINTNIIENSSLVGIMVGAGTGTIVNSIISGNSNYNIQMNGGGPIQVDFSLIKGGYESIKYVYPAQIQYGYNNLTGDEGFLDKENWNYHLIKTSQCIDTGTVEGAPLFDLEGNVRPSGLGFDIGCYEYSQNDPTLLSDLRVDGLTVEGFNPLFVEYSLQLPFGTTLIPVASATPSNPTSTVSILQASKLPGSAKVLVKSADQSQQRTYTVNFTLADNGNWLWARSAAGSFNEEGYSSCTDLSGNVIVSGMFWSKEIDFNGTKLSNSGGADVFIVKYNGLGQQLWVQKIGGESPEYCKDMCTDAAGNIYLVGGFRSRILSIGTTGLNCRGDYDIFVTKMDPSGNFVWSRSYGNNNTDFGQGITVDLGGNVIITGYFSSNTLVVGSKTLANKGNTDIFTIKLDTSGNLIWAQNEGGSHMDFAQSITSDQDGSVYITGGFRSEDFSVGNQALRNSGGEDIFIIKYSAEGLEDWARNYGGTDNESGSKIKSDSFGGIYFTGGFRSGSIQIGTSIIQNSGFSDAFFAKLNTAGDITWSSSTVGKGWDIGYNISIDTDGNSYFIGSYEGETLSLDEKQISSNGDNDIYISKFDQDGKLLWFSGIGGAESDIGYGISTDKNGGVFITGIFESPSINFGGIILTNQGSGDFFVAKIFGSLVSAELPTIEPEVTIYPNPTTGEVMINTPNESMSILIYTYNGNLVQKFDKPDGQAFYKFDVKKGGVYLIKLVSRRNSITRKLVVLGL